MTGPFQAQVLSEACKQGYHLTLSLKRPRHGAHALGACQNHTHFGPQIAPSGFYPFYLSCRVSYKLGFTASLAIRLIALWLVIASQKVVRNV